MRDWRFLEDIVPQYAVVLADLDTSWKQMSFGGKAVAAIHPVHWIDDGIERREAVTEFFAEDTDQSRRRDIVVKYCVNYILLHAERGKDNMPYYDFGQAVADNDTFILLRTDETLITEQCGSGPAGNSS